MASIWDLPDILPGSPQPCTSSRPLPTSPPPPPPPPTTISWDMVWALEAIRAAFPSGKPIGNPDIDFLAVLPAVDGALTLRANKRFLCVGGASRKNQRLKVALAQAAGLVNSIPCNSCERENGIFAACSRAPTKPNHILPVFAGCASCAYNSKGSTCRQRAPPPSPSPPPSSSSPSPLPPLPRATRLQRLLAMTEEEFEEEESLVAEASRVRSFIRAPEPEPKPRSFMDIIGQDDEENDDAIMDVDSFVGLLEGDNTWGLIGDE
ncbi:hypothetical protein N0V82_007753 [Gnomoniopsis sp. IMI 355080]|nr:hypothetical protein N0V82_007753 [Gnomoniopsis sp. IMI 355080]